MRKSTTTPCAMCGLPFEETPQLEVTHKGLCPKCLKDLADRHEKRDRDMPPSRQSQFWRLATLWVLFMASGGAFLLEFPSVISMMTPDKPLRWGTYDTNTKTDKCITNLWKAAGLLQRGQKTLTLTCPESQAPYIILKEKKGDTIVLCPTPKEHGLQRLHISRKHPIPTLTQ